MKTNTHTALAAFEMLSGITGSKKSEVYTQLKKEIPFMLLPDAIRRYIGARQAGHCEVAMNGDNSWMEFPDADVLKTLNSENAAEKVNFHVADDIQKCVIGEYTNFEVFNRHNLGHAHYLSLAMHLMQDDKLDHFLREKLVKVDDRYEDKFVVIHSGDVIDGKTLRDQVSLFEDALFLTVVGMVYRATGTILNRKWFEDVVYDALVKAYPQDLADGTYSFMKMSDELDARISARNFALTDEEKAAITISANIEDDCRDLAVWGFWATKDALK